MAKFKVISVGDRYCVMKFNDDGLYTVVKGSYRETWKGAEAHMETLQFQDFSGDLPAAVDWFAVAVGLATAILLGAVATLVYAIFF